MEALGLCLAVRSVQLSFHLRIAMCPTTSKRVKYVVRHALGELLYVHAHATVAKITELIA